MTTEPVPTPGQTPPVVDMSNPTPAPAPAPAPMPAPAPPAPAPMFANGGLTSPGWFSGINSMDIVIGSLVIAGLTLVILHYKKKIKNQSVEYPELRADVDNLKKDVEEMRTPAAQSSF